MKFKSQLVFIALLTGIFFTSCSSKFSLQKRRYNKGYYFDKTNSTHEQKDGLVKQKPLKNKNLDILNKDYSFKKETKEIVVLKENIISKDQVINDQVNHTPKLAAVSKKEKKSQVANYISKGVYKNQPGFRKVENAKKSKVPFGMGDGGSIWGIVGAISAIISIIFLLIFLISIGSIFSGIGGSSAILGPLIVIGIIVVVLVVIGVLFIINGD
jgi:hypothetical protein